MGLWIDLAEYVGPTGNHGGAMVEQRGMVLHIMAGTYDGSIAWAKNPQSDVSFHFATRRSDGHIGQLLDTDVTAWTQRAGNGHWVSVENEGYLPDALTDAQVEANARLYAKGHLVYGWPLRIANSPTEYGLGHHSMGAENGYDWGHSACPGEAIKAQKQRILDRATAILNGDDMALEGIDRAQLNNAEHYLQAAVGLTANATGISDTVHTDLVVPNALAAAIKDIQAKLANPTPVEVDADAVAAALIANADFRAFLVQAAREGANLAEDS